MNHWKLAIIAGIIIAITACLTVLQAQQPAALLYVVNALSKDISVINTKSDTVVVTIPLQGQGYDIAFSPSSDLAYVTMASNEPVANQQNASQPQLAVINLSQQRVVQHIAMDIWPFAQVHLSPNGAMAYVVTAAAPGKRNDSRGQVLFANLRNGRIERTVPVGLNPLDSVMTPDGVRLYVADWASHSISIVNLRTGLLQDTIPLGATTTRTLAISADGKKVYAMLESSPTLASNNAMNIAQNQNVFSNQQAASISMDTSYLCTIDTEHGQSTRFQVDGLGATYMLEIAPDGKTIYAYGRAQITQNILPQANNPQGAFQLVAINITNPAFIRHYGYFGYISSLAISPDNRKIYLVGTPGDPAQEERVNKNYLQRQGKTPMNGNVQNTVPMADTLQDLRQLKKTVTVLEAASGKVLTRLTIGSFPQKAKIRP